MGVRYSLLSEALGPKRSLSSSQPHLLFATELCLPLRFSLFPKRVKGGWLCFLTPLLISVPCIRKESLPWAPATSSPRSFHHTLESASLPKH